MSAQDSHERTRESVASTACCETPLVTVAWRFLKLEYERQAEIRRLESGDESVRRAAFLRLAEDVFRLGQIATSMAGASEDPSRPLVSLASQLEQSLRRLSVDIVAPLGEHFDGEWLDLFESVAQIPDPATAAPRVVEVISPAVLYQCDLLQMGKVVIAVPVAPGNVE
jgi:hypothetical protein